MKINTGTVPGFGGRPGEALSKPSPKAAKKAEGKFDKVTVRSAEIPTDAKFLEGLKGQILSEVAKGSTIHDLEDLRRQVASSEYEVNPADVVHKIMLNGRD